MVGFEDKYLRKNVGGISRDAQSLYRVAEIFGKVAKFNAHEGHLFPILSKYWNAIRIIIGIGPGKNFTPKIKADIYFYSQFHSYYMRKNELQIVRVHDLFPISNPEWFPIFQRILFNRNVKRIISQSSVFICNSVYTSDSLRALFPEINETRIYVFNCNNNINKSEECGDCAYCTGNLVEVLKKRIFLAVGTIEPRKNYQLLLSSWHSFRQNDSTLVIVGRYGWREKTIYKFLKERKNESIIYLDILCDAGLVTLYKRACLFISCSLKEGFGLPALEANQLNIPLALFDNEIYAELYRDRAYFFDSEETLLDLLNSPNLTSKDMIKLECSEDNLLSFIASKVG